MFKVLNGLALSYLNVRELLTLAQRVVEVVQRAFASVPFLMDQSERLKVDVEALSTAFQKSLGSEFTEKLAQMDSVRDTAYRSFLLYIEGIAAGTLKPDEAAAAASVLRIIDKHNRSLYRLGYASESASLYALVKELSEDDNPALLEKANAVDRYEELKLKMNAFEELYQSKLSEESVKAFPETRKAAKDIAYRLEGLLTAADLVSWDDPATFRQGADELEDAITYIMTPARARHTRRENSRDDDDEPEGNGETAPLPPSES